jgi:hypothetical protein
VVDNCCAECHLYAERHNAECRYAECRGANISIWHQPSRFNQLWGFEIS